VGKVFTKFPTSGYNEMENTPKEPMPLVFVPS